MRAAVVLWTALLLTQAQGGEWLGDAGGTRCGEWVQERARKTSVLGYGLEAWVLGFVSGANSSEAAKTKTRGFLMNFNEDDVFSRVDFYCRQHHDDILIVAASMVIADLLQTYADKKNRELNRR
jgi:hypothetical protein